MIIKFIDDDEMIGNISTSIEKNVLNILSQSKTEINYMNLNMILMILSSTLIKYDVKLKKGDSKLNKAINVIILFLNYLKLFKIISLKNYMMQ